MEPVPEKERELWGKHGAVESAFVWGSVLTPPPLLEPPLEEPSLLGIAVQPRAPECWHSRAEWGRRGSTRHILEAKKKKMSR